MKSVGKPAVVLALMLLAQLGGSPRPNSALDQLERSVRKPLPALPPAPGPRSDQVWVPDRTFPTPDGGSAHVPGHWEGRISSQEYYVPPLLVCTPTGQCVTTPAGVRPLPPDSRQAP